MFPIPEWFTMMGPMAIPLATCSVLVGAIGLERLLYFLRTMGDADAQYHKMAGFLDNNAQHPKSLRDELIANQLMDLKDSYSSGLKWLRTLGAVSPMLGLLGTVLGIIEAFKTISVQTGAISPSLIADGLWQAMLTTAVGLFIAIPAILIGQWLAHLGDSRIDTLAHRLDKKSLEMELIHRGQSPVPQQPSADRSQWQNSSPITGSPMERWQP